MKKVNQISFLFLMSLLLCDAASGHHILGLPHYSYKENYPQAPTLEYPAQSGPYKIIMTCYPGKPIPGQAANLAIYIKNSTNDEPFTDTVNLRVLQTFTFGNNRTVLESTMVQPFENLHKMSVTFPDDGEYVVELTMDVEGQQEVIPFLMVAGEPSATGSILVAVGGGLAVFIIVIRAIKIKRRRRTAAKGDES